MQYIQWLQQLSQGHLFHTLFHKARSSHVLLSRLQVFHVKHTGSQLACLHHLGLWHAYHQGRKPLHFSSSFKFMLIFFIYSPPLSLQQQGSCAHGSQDPSGRTCQTICQSSASSLYIYCFNLSFWKCSSNIWIIFSYKSKMEKLNIRQIWLSTLQVIPICTFLPLSNPCLFIILLDLKQRTLHVVAALNWSQFKAAADFQIKPNVEVLKTNRDTWTCNTRSVWDSLNTHNSSFFLLQKLSGGSRACHLVE